MVLTLMYVTVPTHETQLEIDVASCPLTPKSEILTSPFVLIKMLEGLMSRWTKCLSLWRYNSPCRTLWRGREREGRRGRVKIWGRSLNENEIANLVGHVGNDRLWKGPWKLQQTVKGSCVHEFLPAWKRKKVRRRNERKRRKRKNNKNQKKKITRQM